MTRQQSTPCRLPAEWEEQSAVLLAWPHEATDWVNQLAATQKTFCEIIHAISAFEPVVLIVPDEISVRQRLLDAGINLQQIRFFALPCNDTWARDFGPLCVETPDGPLILDFTFNGWGNKFNAELDNRLTQGLLKAGAFGRTAAQTIDLVMEGGSLESDGAGTLMTTSDCLLEKNRNPQLTQAEIETELKTRFGASRVLWLDHGALQGDDTDSHIDTLARLAPEGCIVFQGCRDEQDEHFSEFAAMHRQLASFTSAAGEPYRLLELPWPQACHDLDGQRLPATYANFLVINAAVLVPVYNDPSDRKALEIIAQAFPQRQIIPIDCRTLIQQHGSLHCVTMQLPKGVLP